MKKSVREWLRFAKKDLLVAEYLLENRRDVSFAIAFHCQQAVEKALKAYLIHFHKRIQKTHDLSTLLYEINLLSANLYKNLEKVVILSEYAVSYRYPDVSRKKLTKNQAKQALKIAKSALALINRGIKSE